jgi:hypothetical protein
MDVALRQNMGSKDPGVQGLEAAVGNSKYSNVCLPVQSESQTTA